MYEKELLCTVAINSIFCYRPRLSNTLLEEFGGFSPLFEMNHSELLKRFGRNYDFLERICDSKTLKEAENEINWAISEGVRIIPISSVDYPAGLKSCADPPALIYVKGNALFDNKRIISVVGTRMPTKYGIECCRMIINSLAGSGFYPIITSGMAYGIDVAAHMAALDTGLNTVAVLPCNVERVYPSAHMNIAKKIMEQGALVSEFPRGSGCLKVNFVQRNRIIAALSQATLVIESGERGGALITAQFAHSYSREVFALPGRIGDLRSKGCNNLIEKNIASIFTSTDSFTDTLGWEKERVQTIRQGKLFHDTDINKEKIIVALNYESGLTRDELIVKSGMKLPLLSATLLEMELEGTIIKLPGERYCTIKR
ncbi:MAG: DNA-processing protein DprA [Bacteroidales bacterium]|nr:DNA-processing protein DprA [Bacteroidales bacterium]